METKADTRMWAISLIVAPVLFTLSSFFWNDGEYSVPAAVLIIFSMLFWIPASAGLFSLVKIKMPRYASWGWLITCYGCISGVCFGFLGYISTVLAIPHTTYLQAFEKYPISAQLLLFASGPVFPLSILLLSIIFIRTKNTPLWISICFALGAICFPLSRITRTEWIAHIVDMLWLIPSVYIAMLFLKKAR